MTNLDPHRIATPLDSLGSVQAGEQLTQTSCRDERASGYWLVTTVTSSLFFKHGIASELIVRLIVQGHPTGILSTATSDRSLLHDLYGISIKITCTYSAQQEANWVFYARAWHQTEEPGRSESRYFRSWSALGRAPQVS
jgi:hypothetical protein